jgi:hypothetical protein
MPAQAGTPVWGGDGNEDEDGLRRHDPGGETPAVNLEAVFTGITETAVDFQFTLSFDGGWPPC